MPIRVLIVEDSLIAMTILTRILASSPEIEVAGTARTGKEALELISEVKPDVICTDLHMPQMDGLEFTKEVMIRYPRPILVISASVQQQEDSSNVFQLLEAGAVDVFPKPPGGSAGDYEAIKRALISKIKILSGVKVFTRHSRRNQETKQEQKPRKKLTSTCQKIIESPPQKIIRNRSLRLPPNTQFKMIVVGASTGGPQALKTFLTGLQNHLNLPVICVQHISEGFLQGLVDWLGSSCHLPVQIARPGELPQPGKVYFAPEQLHLELDNIGRFIYAATVRVDGHRPSVTVTFRSVAKLYGKRTIGILLTGMGKDGAAGMEDIAKAGGLTIAQDEASSVVFGMPKAAIALNAAQYILPIDAIAPHLLQKVISR
ncbi:MAG: chemotaxis-specific protein-glutamate methyltransferase CheB [Oscillatoria sp. PMC 1051.18]|nr:chemotaxis-specific protein-glutamate methyltransferase CheB [Oscillatoria sp. PMC 1050.18]MEC5030702.1 chemotaxis-specific protein-glutamate methyltransferase CheB [Oscillatoria sp. PMC 1051.18]